MQQSTQNDGKSYYKFALWQRKRMIKLKSNNKRSELLFSQTILQIFHICVSHLDFLLCQRLPIKRLPSPADPLAHSVEWWLMCTPSSLTQFTTNDRVSLNDMHLKVVALRHRCFSGQVETDHPTSFVPFQRERSTHWFKFWTHRDS